MQTGFTIVHENKSGFPPNHPGYSINRPGCCILQQEVLLQSSNILLKGLKLLLRHGKGSLLKGIAYADDEEDASTANGISSRLFERITECVLAAVNVQAEACASYIPHFLALYTDIVLSLDTPRVHSMRTKSRTIIVKFLARVLTCHVYKMQWGWEERLGENTPCRCITSIPVGVWGYSQMPTQEHLLRQHL